MNYLKHYLEEQGVFLELESSEETDFVEIKWKKNADCHYVYSTDIVYHKGRLAWFQSSEANNYQLCILENENLWQWEPILYNSFFGCLCLELCWIKEDLIFLYKEKHDVYITVVNKGQVRYHNFNGEKFKLATNRLAYQTYGQASRDLVSVLEIPSLKPLETIELRAARQLGLEPMHTH